MTAFLELVARDVRLAFAGGGSAATALGFYLVVVALIPLGIGPDLGLLARIAPGVLWVALLLAALLSLPRMFEADHEDGALDVLATGPLPLELVVVAKSLAHWLTVGLPLALISPVLGLLLNLDLSAAPALVATMLAGTPAVSCIGALGAALALGARKGGLLLALLVLPLYIPTLIFGILALDAVPGSTGTGLLTAPGLILAAISCVMIATAPIAAAAALRLQMQ